MQLHIKVGKDNSYHYLSRCKAAYYKVSQIALLSANIIELQVVLQRIVLYKEPYAVRWLSLQVAAFYIQHLVKKAGNVESAGRPIRRSYGIWVLTLQHPSVIREGKVQLVAVMGCLGRAKNRGDLRQLQVPYAGKLVHHLLLFKGKLPLVGEMLPGAASAYAKVTAEGLHPVWRGGYYACNIPHHIAAAHLVNLHIHHIARYSLLNKEHLAIYLCNRISLCRKSLYLHILKEWFYLLSSHYLKLSPFKTTNLNNSKNFGTFAKHKGICQCRKITNKHLCHRELKLPLQRAIL